MRNIVWRSVLLAVLGIFIFGAVGFSPSQAAVDACDYYVDPAGSNGNPGTMALPWATLEYAFYNADDNSCTVWFNPGVYDAASVLDNSGGGDRFTTTTTFKSFQPYKAILQNPDKVLDLLGVQNMIFEGFEIKQTTPAPTIRQVVIDFHRATSPVLWANNIIFRNNIIHNANGEDIALLKGGVQYITFENNVFYNQGGEQQMLDINSALDITVQDNIFFNDFSNPENFRRSFIEIKDTNGNTDGYEGSKRIKIRRNVFLNYQGADYGRFVQVGVGDETFHMAQDITVENNLMIGNSPKNIDTAFGVSGSKNVYFVNNTVVGDLPASAYAMEITKQITNPLNENIYFYNNIWSDPTGSMGACYLCGANVFSMGDPLSFTNLVLDNNLYYNGGSAIPTTAPEEIVNPLVADVNRVVADPGLETNQSSITLPRWNGSSFLSGNTTIQDEFSRLVEDYGSILPTSPASGAANNTYAPTEDIRGVSRPGSPSIGAYEPLNFASSIQLTKTSDVQSAAPGEDIVYTIVIQNNSDSSAPDLIFDSIIDSMKGDLTKPPNYDSSTCGNKLASSASCTITYTYTVQQSDTSPLMNIATVSSHPSGYSFSVGDSDNASVTISGTEPQEFNVFLPFTIR